jgi:hypothetical protein
MKPLTSAMSSIALETKMAQLSWCRDDEESIIGTAEQAPPQTTNGTKRSHEDDSTIYGYDVYADLKLQSNAKRRRYQRRGSKSASMFFLGASFGVNRITTAGSYGLGRVARNETGKVCVFGRPLTPPSARPKLTGKWLLPQIAGDKKGILKTLTSLQPATTTRHDEKALN